MASADFRQTLAQRISLGQYCDFPLTPPSSTGCRLMTFGLRCHSPVRHQHPASLLVRVPAAKSSLPVLSTCALRPRPNLPLRLASSPPSGSFHPDSSQHLPSTRAPACSRLSSEFLGESQVQLGAPIPRRSRPSLMSCQGHFNWDSK